FPFMLLDKFVKNFRPFNIPSRRQHCTERQEFRLHCLSQGLPIFRVFCHGFLGTFVGRATHMSPFLIATLMLMPTLVPSTRVARPAVVVFDKGSVATSET